MKNSLRSLLASVAQWFYSPRRAQPREHVSQEQLRKALADMLADPQTRRLILSDLVGTVLPIQGGVCAVSAKDVGPGDFGSDPSCGGGDYSFPAKLGVGTASPVARLDATNTIRALSSPGTPPASGKGVELQYDSAGDVGLLLAIDRTIGAFKPLLYFAAPHQFANVLGEVMRIDVIGNVGIGTTTPARRLHVVGAAGEPSQLRLEAAAGAAAGLELYEGATRRAVISTGATTVSIFNEKQLVAEAIHINQSTGNVGIGTTTPAEKLDVAGNIKSDGLNKIVFLRPLGAPTDDGDRINQAIDGLPDDGGIIYLLPGVYNIKTPVKNTNKSAVKLRGFGGEAFAPHTGLTTLKWDTSSTDPDKYVVRLESNTLADFMEDFELSDLTIDGNGVAQIGLYLNRISTSKFISVRIQNMKRPGFPDPSVGIKLTSVNGDAHKGSHWNTFINCSVWEASQGVFLTGESTMGPVEANSAHNNFRGLSIGYYSEAAAHAGILLGNCDNNCFTSVWIFPIRQFSMQPVDGPGVLVDNPTEARANYFYHLQASADPPANPSFWVREATSPPPMNLNKNLIFGYDLSNGQGQPRAFDDGTELTNVDDYLFWVDSRGKIRGGQLL